MSDKIRYVKELIEDYGYEPFLNFAQECVGDSLSAIRDVKSYNYSKEEDKAAIYFSCDNGSIVVGVFYPLTAELYFYDQNSKSGLGQGIAAATKSWQKVVLKHTKHKEDYLIDVMYRIKDEAAGRYIP